MTTEIVDTNVEPEGQEVINSADAELQDLKIKLEKQTQLVEKLRQQEKHNQGIAKEVGAKNLEDALRALQSGYGKEVDEWKTKFETLNSEYSNLKENVKSRELDSVLKDVLTKSNVKDINTTLKVIDKTKVQWTEDGQVDATSLEVIVNELKTTDPILFNEVQIPDVKTAGQGTPIGGFEKEITACKTQKEIEAVLKKFNR